jgi:phosphoribosylformimino-5-aminoimidazole carboxamide ribotide isomerase
MQIIPVIDLLEGQVVRAVRGERARYAPINSALCGSSDPHAVAQRLLQACNSSLLYIADIDALTGKPAQAHLFTKLLETMPELNLWLDAAFTSPAQARQCINAWCANAGHDEPGYANRITPVIGTESLAHDIADPFMHDDTDWVLSLDQRHGKRLGAGHWFDHPRHWPANVIVMNLDHVGAAAGPDLQALRDAIARSQGLPTPRRIIGAGGIRNDLDCDQAARAGAHAWLVASALHDLRIATTRTALKSHDKGI